MRKHNKLFVYEGWFQVALWYQQEKLFLKYSLCFLETNPRSLGLQTKSFQRKRQREIFARVVAETVMSIYLFISVEEIKASGQYLTFHWLIECNRRAVNHLFMHFLRPIISLHISGNSVFPAVKKFL